MYAKYFMSIYFPYNLRKCRIAQTHTWSQYMDLSPDARVHALQLYHIAASHCAKAGRGLQLTRGRNSSQCTNQKSAVQVTLENDFVLNYNDICQEVHWCQLFPPGLNRELEFKKERKKEVSVSRWTVFQSLC